MEVVFLPHGAPKIPAVVPLQSCTESGMLLLTLLCAGMERFLPSASGSSAPGLKPSGEPTCKLSLNLSHRFTSVLAGDPCMGFVVGDDTIFVAHKNHSIEHNRLNSNHSRTPLSYEDVDPQRHSFLNTAVVQFWRSRRGRLLLPKKKETFSHLQRCDHFFGVFVTC